MSAAQDIPALIESAVGGSAEDMRNVLQVFYAQFQTLNSASGNNFPTGRGTATATAAPAAGQLSVSGANGTFSGEITNPSQSISATIYNEVSYSPIKGFSSNVTTRPIGTGTAFTVPNPGQQLFFRCRWSFDQQTWSPYVLASTAAVSSGLQSSAATDNAVVLNQSNYAYVDSIATGATAAVRVYGAAGPYTGYVAQKGTAQGVRPSATIINVTQASNQFVAYDGQDFQVKTTLPQVFDDSWEPVGKVAVVGSGSPTLPVIVLLVQGGYVVGIKSTSTFGSGLTQLPTFTITDSTGTGAAIVATGLNAGAITGIQVTNAGNGTYSATPTVTAHGGVFSGTGGGGTSVGGNGARLTAV